MTRTEMNEFDRRTLRAECGKGRGRAGTLVVLTAREARELARYVERLEQALRGPLNDRELVCQIRNAVQDDVAHLAASAAERAASEAFDSHRRQSGKVIA